MHLYISYAERSRVSKPTDFVQRQHKTGVTMDMDGGMRGDRSQKRLRPRKVIEGAQKKFGRPYG